MEIRMSKRIDRSWLVFTSIENAEHNKCVDLFSRPDGSYGFEEFRRDVEDCGEWTPISYFSGSVYSSEAVALAAALKAVGWLTEAVRRIPSMSGVLQEAESQPSDL
jgi:hypothetical protein